MMDPAVGSPQKNAHIVLQQATGGGGISNAGSYYIFNSGIVKGAIYDIWSQKSGYSNSSINTVTAVGV